MANASRSRTLIISILVIFGLCCFCFVVAAVAAPPSNKDVISTNTPMPDGVNITPVPTATADIKPVLSESIKKEVYRVIVENEARARQESERKYPSVPGQAGYIEGNLVRANEYKSELNETYKSEVMTKYEITSQTYTQIIVEGTQKSW